MTDPAADEPEGSDEPGSKLDAALGAFKTRSEDADTSRVSDSGRPRMNWDPVTDTGGGGATDTQPRSSFQFDLGSALARLSGAVDPSSLTADGPRSDESEEPEEPPSPVQEGGPAEAQPPRGVAEHVQTSPVHGRQRADEPSDVSAVGRDGEPLPTRGADDPAATLPTRGADEPAATLPTRDVGESSKPLPTRGADDPAATLPTRGADGPAATLPRRGADEPAASLPTRDVGESSEPLPVRESAEASEPLPVRESAEASEPLPVRGVVEPQVDSLPTRTSSFDASEPASPPVVDRLPTRTPRPAEPSPTEVATPPSRPAARQATKKSVFDDASPAPTLPAAGTPTVAPTGDAPTLPAAAAVTSGMPTLPASAPAASPSVTAPVESAPSTPELNALRSAQLRAHRNERQGKLFGRALLAFLVVGGLVAAALLFGRSYLFPTEWTAELTPLVDEVQSSRDAEFDHTLALVERPATEYGPLVTAHVLGDDWDTRLPEWRALGLAGADGAVADVQARVAGLYPAFYDAEADELVAAAGVSPEGREAALRLALDSALTDQLTGGDAPAMPGLGLTGLESTDALARRAVEAAGSGVAGSAPDAVADLAGVPLPVAYQLRAIDELGDDLLGGVPAPPAGAPLPESASRLDAVGERATGGLRQPGDQEVLEPVALGPDAWAMIWGTRLPPATAGRMADSLVADSYAVVNRSGATCFLAVFETDTDASGTTLLSNLTTWVGNAPAAAQAAATQLGPTRLQTEACDPGADGAVAPPVVSVDLVLQRQLDRLTVD